MKKTFIDIALKNHYIRQFGIKKNPKKLVISLLFCSFIVENQSLTKHI